MSVIPNNSLPTIKPLPSSTFTGGNMSASGDGAKRINPSFEQATVPQQPMPDITAWLQATYGPNMTKQQLFDQLRNAAMGNG